VGALTKRHLLHAGALGALGLLARPAAVRAWPVRPAAAQSWPVRPVHFVVPAAPGAGILDIMARVIAGPLGARLGQQLVIDNKPGAANNVGAEFVAKAAPDGYTLLICNSSLIVAPHLYPRLGYDPMDDLVPVSQINSAPLMLVVHPSVPAHSVAELIAYARDYPGRLNYGSAGVGSTPFLATELFKSMTGINLVHVPYRGGAPALADLVAGQVSVMIESMPGTMPFVRDGKLRALAVTSRKRSALAPELPTMDEAGVAGYEMIGWNGVFVARGTSPAIVERLAREIAAVLALPEVDARLAQLGAEPVGSTPVAFAAFMRAESVRWSRIIRERGIKSD
jgi:tripartite-type tricarboxylate transporter receptor subunit TctC